MCIYVYVYPYGVYVCTYLGMYVFIYLYIYTHISVFTGHKLTAILVLALGLDLRSFGILGKYTVKGLG